MTDVNDLSDYEIIRFLAERMVANGKKFRITSEYKGAKVSIQYGKDAEFEDD